MNSRPIAMKDCQCRDCQGTSCTGHGSYLTLPSREAVKFEGEATHWDMVGDSGNVKTRGFCPACGSPVYLTFSAMPDLFTIHARASTIQADTSRRWCCAVMPGTGSIQPCQI